MASRKNEVDFFERIPRPSMLVFFVAVFFTFSPVSLLLASSFVQERPLGTVALYMVISGLVAVCWAATFTRSRWFIVGIVLFSLILMVGISGPVQRTPFGIREAGASVEGAMITLSIALGYVLFIVFISGRGRTTLRLMTEMDLAQQIHSTLVPPIELTDGRLEATGVSTPSSEVGGDLIEVVRHEATTDFFVADVSGHGVKAGVVMAMVKAAIHSRSLREEPFAEVMRDINAVLERTTGPELYATLAGVRVERATGRGEFGLAGHHHILRYRANGGSLDRLSNRGFPIGMMAGTSYETGAVQLESGDLLAVYTDGLNETVNAADDELGHDVIERTVADQASRPLAEIRDVLLALAASHGPQDDDRSLLLVRYSGAA